MLRVFYNLTGSKQEIWADYAYVNAGDDVLECSIENGNITIPLESVSYIFASHL